jgi:hypothetical protein
MVRVTGRGRMHTGARRFLLSQVNSNSAESHYHTQAGHGLMYRLALKRSVAMYAFDLRLNPGELE